KAAYFQIAVGKRAYHRKSRIGGRKGIYRRSGPRGILFVLIASAAESFRSTCGSERGAPECSKQRSPRATPHVGQGTENNCFSVRSPFLIWIRCAKTSRKTIPYRTLFAPGIGDCRSYRTTVGNGLCRTPPPRKPQAPGTPSGFAFVRLRYELGGISVQYGTAQPDDSLRKSSQSSIVLLVSRNLLGRLS